MKGKKKLVLPLLLAGVTATTGYVAPVTQAVSAATSTTSNYYEETKVVGEKIQIKGFQDTYSIGDNVYLPKVEGASNIEYSVTKVGKKVELLTVSDENLAEHTGHNVGDKYFKADYEGYYNIEVATVVDKSGDNLKQVKTVVDKLSVYVNKTDASIVLPVNSQYVIPAKVQKNETGLKIPAPSVIVGDNEEATAYKDLTGGQELKVSIYTPKGKEIELSANTDKTYFEVNEYTEGTQTNKILSEAGTYTIVYKFMIDGAVVSTLDSNFQVVNSYDTDKMKLTMTLQDSMPTSGNINTEVSIPKVKVTENATSLDAINAHVKVTIKNLTTGREVTDFDYEKYTFTPTEKGDYVVSYKADINVFNKTSEEITVGTTIKVSDKKGATVMPTYDYVVDGNNANKIITVNGSSLTESDKLEDKMLNIEHSIPSVLKLKTNTEEYEGTHKYVEITIPAIYGTDNCDELSELTFTRSYRDPNGYVKTIDDQYSKITTDTNNTLNKAKTIKLTKAGTYEFRYKAVDKANNTAGYKEYTVVVYDEDKTDLENGTAKVELNIPYSYVSDKDEYLTFSAPTASDTYDKNIKVETNYVLLNGEGNVIANTEKTLADADKDGKNYRINVKKLIADNPTANSIKVTAKAYLDGSLVDTRAGFGASEVTRENGFIVLTNTKEVRLVNSSSDQTPAELTVEGGWNSALLNVNKTNDQLEMVEYSSASVYSINEYGFAVKDSTVVTIEGGVKQSPFSQGDGIIKLPEVKFKDKDDNLSVSVVIKNAYGNTITPVSNARVSRSEKDEEGNYTYTVDSASFKLSNYGIYTVTYTAKDVGGNITTQTFGIRVNDKTKPTIVVDDEDKFDEAIEVGEKFVVPTAKLIKNGSEIDAQSITWDIVDTSTTEYDEDSTGFTPWVEGTFKIVYHAVDINGNTAELDLDSYILSAKDTTAPVLKLNDVFVGTLAWNPDVEGGKEQTISIPNANANDTYKYGEASVQISISGPNSSTPTIIYEKDAEGNEVYSNTLKFKAESQGTYTIKYTATDKAGNTTTETKELRLGDCEAPELTWDNEEEDIPTTATLNDKLTIDLGKITLTDNETDATYLSDKLTVSLIDPNGSTVSGGTSNSRTNPYWNITSTGTYTLKFVVKDEAGNSETYSYKVEVPTEDVEDETISPVVGTILVVVAVVVLAGVVVYFVVSSKKKTPASRKNSKKASK